MPYYHVVIFTKYVYTDLTYAEYLVLQNHLLHSPESRKVVPGSGGVQKLRWVMSGVGKRGGEIWLLTIYSKSETENIPAHILRKIAEEIQNV